MVSAMVSTESTVARRTGVWFVPAFACKITLYTLPAVKPLIVVLSVVPPVINATFVPFGTVPLFAKVLSPAEGLKPAPLGLSVVQPVIWALSLIYPGATEKLFASKLALVIVWPREICKSIELRMVAHAAILAIFEKVF